jgi:transcription elongation factor Elf1
MLTCTRCKTTKPATSEFFPFHNKKKNGLDSWCRNCRATYRSEIRRGHYRDMVSDSALKNILANVFSCTICGSEEKLVVDHDHESQVIRGLLCNHCNRGLGHFKDNPELLEYAKIYLLASKNNPEASDYVKQHSGMDLYGELYGY